MKNIINLNIAGAVVHYKKLLNTIRIAKLTNKNINFNVYDGPNLCQWNGGRINKDIILTDDIIEMYNKSGISISLAFTNHTINVNDDIGNNLLNKLNFYGEKYNIKNKIILVNEDFRKYLRKNFNFELVFSITGHDSDVKLDDNRITYYKDLEKKYDWIVPKFEHVFEPQFFNNVDTSKYELLINDACIYGCPHYKEHFKSIADHNTNSKNPLLEFGEEHCKKIQECWLPWFNPDIGHQKHKDKYKEKMGMNYTREMLKLALKIGYVSFKLSGRENATDYVASEVNKFCMDIK